MPVLRKKNDHQAKNCDAVKGSRTIWDGPSKMTEPRTKKPRKPLSKASAKQAKALKEYTERRTAFLMREENQYCPVMKFLKGWHVRTCQIHHMARRGKNLNNESTWLAVSVDGHNWIESNPNLARRYGWLK